MNASTKNITVYIPFELLKISSITSWEKHHSKIVDYYYRHYSYFHQERSKILGKLKTALNENNCEYTFNKWHRLVTYQYSNNPLSSKGSLLNDPGGRFNIGDINRYKFQPFPALYIAEDFDTAYREAFQLKQDETINGLHGEELSLYGNNSFSNVVLNGEIHYLLDLRKKKTLQTFYQEIKNIKLPSSFKKEAESLKIPVIPHVKSLKELMNSILSENWRDSPIQADIPSNSQILGQIAEMSGVEAILYPSIRSRNKYCIAIFPRNFNGSSSYVKLKDRAPDDVKITSLNRDSYMKLI